MEPSSSSWAYEDRIIANSKLMSEVHALANLGPKRILRIAVRAIQQHHDFFLATLISAPGIMEIEDAQGQNLLHVAVECGNMQAVQILTQQGALLIRKDDKGRLPHQVANNPDIQNTIKAKIGQLFHAAVLMQRNDIVKYYCEELPKDDFIHSRNEFNQTPLHVACQYNPYAAELLVKHGANPNLRDFYGRKPNLYGFKG